MRLFRWMTLCLVFAPAVLAQRAALYTGEYLRTGEYIVGQDRQHFAVLQGDGNFCIYRGSGPEDNRGYVWGTQKTAPGGVFFAILQSDGNFCIYRGNDPSTQGAWHWGSQKTAPGGQFILRLLSNGMLSQSIVNGPVVWEAGVPDVALGIDAGGGFVRFSDGVTCEMKCSRFATPGQTLTVTASPVDRLVKWTGTCAHAGVAESCTMTVPSAPAEVRAEFCAEGQLRLGSQCVVPQPWTGGIVPDDTRVVVRTVIDGRNRYLEHANWRFGFTGSRADSAVFTLKRVTAGFNPSYYYFNLLSAGQKVNHAETTLKLSAYNGAVFAYGNSWLNIQYMEYIRPLCATGTHDFQMIRTGCTTDSHRIAMLIVP